MIYETHKLSLPLKLTTDLCVIGSGAGGAMAAMATAEAGMKVVVLEAGEYFTPADMVQREESMFPRLYWDAGGRTTADKAVKIHQGRGVGGSTLHNLNLCKRIPSVIRERWAKKRGLSALPASQWDSLYDEVESLLSVSSVAVERYNVHNKILERGCKALNWKGGGLMHNRTGCVGSGFCEVGCAFDGKNNAAKIAIPRAVKAGASILTCCQVVKILHDDKKTLGVVAKVLDPKTREYLGEVQITCSKVCVSASATASAALLLRSKIPDPAQGTGNNLQMHPAVVVAGDFDEEVKAWEGIPQTYECTEFLDFEKEDGNRVWIVPAFAHPMGLATMVPGYGKVHRELMGRYSHLAALTAMVHDQTAGKVRPDGDLGLKIDYWPDSADRKQLLIGLHASAKLLFAAGAKRVMVPKKTPKIYDNPDQLDELLKGDIERGDTDITAVHPMSSIPMGDDPKTSSVDSTGKHHHLAGLWVADGSLFPTSIGVPPQLSIYTMGLHVGRGIAKGG